MQTVMCVLIVNSNFKSDGLHLRPLDEAFPKFTVSFYVFFLSTSVIYVDMKTYYNFITQPMCLNKS